MYRRFTGLPGVLALVCVAAVVAVAAPAPAAPTHPAQLMRFPNIHGDTVVFVYGEDLWSAPVAGGLAHRLTANPGEERYPHFSPDGTLIAFTAEYDGNPDVYVMNADGSDVRRVTYHPAFDEVVGWQASTGKILFRSSRTSFQRFDRLFVIAPDGSGLEQLPLAEAAHGSFSPDGTKIVYNRIAREHRTWKRYFGGLAQDLWIYDFNTREDRKITDFPGTDRLPQWIGDTIYFDSDRDGRLNIWAYDVVSGDVTQRTHHEDFDVHWPSADGALIAYEVAGDLWVLDTTTGVERKLAITVGPDAPEVRPYLKNVKGFITSVDVSPSGARAAVVARGDVFTVPREHGATRNLTSSSGARDRGAVWSPDGARIAYVSDATGEYQIWIAGASGDKPPEKLTDFPDGYRYSLRWSPDSTKLSFSDQTHTLSVIDIATKKITAVDRAEFEPMDVSLDAKPIADATWSPDGRFLAYSKMNSDLVSQLWIVDLQSGEKHLASGPLFNDFGPVFTNDGEHLLFVSNRRFDPTFGDFEWEMVYKKVAGIYSLTLRRDGPPMLPLESDEEGGAKAAVKGEKPAEKAAPVQVRIDFDGLADRVQALPVPRGNYRQLAVTGDALYYLDSDEGDYNRFEFRELGPRDLWAYRFAKREAHRVIEKVDGYALAAGGGFAAYRKGETVGILELGGGEIPEAVKAAGFGPERYELDLADLEMTIDPRAEWRQVYDEAWRMERDYYYDPAMHGLDWPAVRAKYAKLLDGATSTEDLTYVIGEMIGELATSHTYIYGGSPHREAENVDVGLLGADYTIDPSADRYRISRIYRVPDWSHDVTPPLAAPGVDVREGDYLLQVNGREVHADREVYAAFQNLAGKQVLLTVNSRPTLEGARTVTVVPLASERTLRYLDWVEHNRRLVDEASNGEIGYLHLPDTYLGSAVEFPKYFYSQTQKKGLVVDGRFNGGGLDPHIFLQRLAKRPMSYWTRRYSHDQFGPAVCTNAHLVLLTNHQAGSGGDELPLEFREMGLGPIIGTRTWGGLVGVSMFVSLMDGHLVTVPDYRIYTPEGKWVVENEGVTPDITVELDSAQMAAGHDAQLEKGLAVLTKTIQEHPRPWPQHPPFPKEQ